MKKLGRKKIKKSDLKINKSIVMHPKLIKKIKKEFHNYSFGVSKIVEEYYSDKE